MSRLKNVSQAIRELIYLWRKKQLHLMLVWISFDLSQPERDIWLDFWKFTAFLLVLFPELILHPIIPCGLEHGGLDSWALGPVPSWFRYPFWGTLIASQVRELNLNQIPLAELLFRMLGACQNSCFSSIDFPPRLQGTIIFFPLFVCLFFNRSITTLDALDYSVWISMQ